MSLSLRLWAFLQFFRSCGLYAKEVVRSLRVFAAKRKLRRQRYTFDDVKASFHEDVVRIGVRGHLNQIPFTGIEDDFPEVRSGIATTSDRLVFLADQCLKKLEQGAVGKTGVLNGYAAAQRRHLKECARCRSFVCGVIVGDTVAAAHRAALLKNGVRNRHG
jgi:hypothetical protein